MNIGSSLFIGLDESNHHKSRYEEIIAAAFSPEEGEARLVEIKGRPARLKKDEVSSWINCNRKDYRFTQMHHNTSSLYSNLIIATPYLIGNYLSRQDKRYLDNLETINIQVDGILLERERERLKSVLEERIKYDDLFQHSPDIGINSYPKKKAESPTLYSHLLRIADALASVWYHNLRSHMARDKKYPNPAKDTHYVDVERQLQQSF